MNVDLITTKLQYLAVSIAAGYGAYEMPSKEEPYAFIACTFGVLYGLYGMVALDNALTTNIMDTIMDIVPISLINMEIYTKFDNSYALAHGLCIIPLTVDVIVKLLDNHEYEGSTQILKNANDTANFASICTLAYLEENYMIALIGLAFLFSHLGVLFETNMPKLAEFCHQAGYCAMYASATLAITEETNPAEEVSKVMTIPVLSPAIVQPANATAGRHRLFNNFTSVLSRAIRN